MERLTERDTNGHWRIKEFSEVLPAYWQACNRLAAYEDTGLEPEEICAAQKAMRSALALACELQAYRALGAVEEMSALVKARDEGRVLPEKSMWTTTCKGRKLVLVMDVKAAHEAEVAIGGGGND